MTGLIYIVDDDALLRQSLAGLLTDEGYRVMEFASAEAFLDHPLEYTASCLLLDIKMDGMSGFELQKMIMQRDFIPPIIFLTGSARLEEAVDAMRLGASHFLIKPIDDEQLLQAVELAIERSSSDAEFFAFLQSLTATEKKIAHLMRKGLLSKQIASELGNSIRTVEWHRKNITRKGYLRKFNLAAHQNQGIEAS